VRRQATRDKTWTQQTYHCARRHWGIEFCNVDDRLAPIEREISPERNQRSENCAEDTAFAHMKPVCLDLDDRDRAVTLEIHVERVGHRKNREQPYVNAISQDKPGDD